MSADRPLKRRVATANAEQRIFRGDLKSNFAVLPNAMFEDDRLSLEARGAMGYILSRPLKWNIRIAHLAKTLNAGRDKLRRIIRELIAAGYIQRKQARNGKFYGRMDYYVYSEPTVTSSSQTPFQSTDSPSTDSPSTEKASAYKERSLTSKDSNQVTSSSKGGGGIDRSCTEQAACPKKLGNEGRSRSERPEVIQARLAERFGCGDVANGWLLLGMLAPSHLDQLTAQERNGSLSDGDVRRMLVGLRNELTRPLPAGSGAP
jgi:DNA-binding MarR family transcriptional regulator